MKQRIYIDVNSSIGRTKHREERIPYKIEELLDEMKYCRVHASVVYSEVAKDYSFVKGNSQLIDDISSSKRLFGIAAVVPDIQFELENGYGYYDNLLERGIRAFKLYPKSFGFRFDPRSIEMLAQYMAEKNIPMVVDFQEIDCRNLEEVLGAFPGLKVLLCNTGWGGNRLLFPLMSKYGNLYYENSSNQANSILEISKKHFGIDRILFGSRYPYKVMGAIKALIEYSDLSEDDKDRIAHKNAAQLFNINPEEIKPYEETELMLDEIALKVDCGKALDDITVIDSHTHMVDKEHVTTSQVVMLYSDADSMIRKMDRLGIDRIITSPWEGIMTDGISANETSLRANKKYGKRIEVYATCNPNYNEDLCSVVDLYHEKYGFIGIKPYWPAHQYDILGEKYKKWFEYGNKNRLIMLVHSGTEEIAKKVEVLSGMYKDISFILAHSGISYQVADWNIEVAKKRENVFLEITYTSLTNGVIEYLVEKAGAHKVLFGTDMPMRDPAPQLAWVTYAKIPVEDKKKILGENILRLIDRCYT